MSPSDHRRTEYDRWVERRPTVSILIPAYNGAAYLAEAIGSALAQTEPAAEVLLFDNGSTDATRQIALDLLPSPAVTSYEVNSGAVVNFNRSVMASTGEFVLWLAADDRLAPRHVELCSKALEEHPETPACLPGIRFIDPAGRELRVHTDAELASPDPSTRLRAFLRRPRWTEFYCLYRRDSLLASPLVTQEYGADVLLTWWFLLRGPLAVIEEPLLDYREYPTKSVAEMALALDPNAKLLHWRKIRLWKRLREMTQDPGVDPRTARAARRELRACLGDSNWRGHLLEDVILRWPRVTRAPLAAALRLRDRRREGARVARP